MQVSVVVSCTSSFQVLLFSELDRVVASITLEDSTCGCGVGGLVLEGFSSVVLRACPNDWFVVSVVGVMGVFF